VKYYSSGALQGSDFKYTNVNIFYCYKLCFFLFFLGRYVCDSVEGGLTNASSVLFITLQSVNFSKTLRVWFEYDYFRFW
jgi:hypothetical protein